MAKEKRKTVNPIDAIIAMAYVQETLLNVLVSKGIVKPEEIQKAVLLEAEQVCPFNVKVSAVDYQLIPNGENDVRGILVAGIFYLFINQFHLSSVGGDDGNRDIVFIRLRND